VFSELPDARVLPSGLQLDVCNIVNSPTRFYNQAGIQEGFRKLGRWIACCHAKDPAWMPEYNVRFAEVISGRGGRLRNLLERALKIVR
jgi:hypothetical protein